LTLLNTPAGFGKTTLLTAWYEHLTAEGKIVAWLTLDQDDNDRTRFIEYLTEAFTTALHNLADDLSEFENVGNIVSEKIQLTSILNAVQEMGHEVTLVLDDYDKITDPSIHELLGFLLQHIPSNLHIVAACRAAPPLPLPLAILRARDQLIEINLEALRFSIEETHSFFANSISTTLSANEIRTIHDTTGGWAVGLQIATLSIPECNGIHRPTPAFLSPAPVLDEYLRENVLSRIPVETVDFMLRTSILDRLHGALCKNLTGRSDAVEKLEWLVQQNLFLQPLDEGREWYGYHALFADFLRAQLKRRLPEAAEELHLRAAEWFSGQGLWAEAVRHALNADRSDLAVEWLERCALGELGSGRVRIFLAWIRKLPQEALKQRINLRIALIWALLLTAQPGEARALADEVDAQLRENPPPDGDALRRTLRAQRVSIFSMQDRIGAALTLGKAVWRERFPGNRKPEHGFDWIDEAFLNAMLHLHRKAGDLEAARQVGEFYRPKADVAHNLLLLAYYACLLATLEIQEAQMYVAAQRLERQLEACERQVGRRSATAALCAATLAGIYYEWNRLDAVESLLANRLDVIDETSFIEPTQTAYISLARIYVVKGLSEAALSLLDHAEMLGERRDWPGLTAACTAERLRIQLRENQIAAAERSLNKLDAIRALVAQNEPDRVDVEMLALSARAHLLLHLRRFAEAQALLVSALATRKKCPAATRYEVAQLRTLLAIAHHAAGNAGDAQGCLAEVLALSARNGMVRLLADEGQAIVPILFIHAAAEGETSPRVDWWRRLFAALGIEAPFGKISAADHATEALSRREMLILELLMQDISNKQIAKALSIAPETVKWHLKAIYRKLGVSDRYSAVQLAQARAGLCPAGTNHPGPKQLAS
jgi:LuxR family maltose regulon positive regulatory protein